jgi:hypothetical protein
MKTDHYIIETPEVSMTFIGTIEPDGDYAWMCNPRGDRILRVESKYVRKTSPQETADKMFADAREQQRRN